MATENGTEDSESSSASDSDLDDTTLDPTYDITKDPDFIAMKKRQKRAEKLISGSEEAAPSNQIIEEQSRLHDQQMAGPSMPNDMADNQLLEKKSTRKSQRKPETRKRNIRKNLNDQGLEHVDSSGKVKAKKKVRVSVECSKCRFKCSEKINDEERLSTNDEYWSLMDYSRKKDFLLANIEVNNVERVRVDSDKRKRTRQCSKTYSFTRRGNKHRVCQKFFLSTLNISSGPIDKAINGKNDGCTSNANDQRGRHTAWNKTPEEKMQAVKDHINLFPRIESHFTRKSTKRRYLDPSLSITKMNQLFVKYCKENDLEPASERTYRKTFCEKLNLSFFKPKRTSVQPAIDTINLPQQNKRNKERHTKNILSDTKTR